MISSSLVVASVFLLAAQDPGQAQTGQPAFPGTIAPVSDRAEVYRHIGIMKQLLRRKLGATHGLSWAATAQPANPLSSFQAYPNADYTTFAPMGQGPYFGGRPDAAVDGVYLPDYGVVFTVATSMPVQPARNKSDKPAAKPSSDWDQTERELKGERVESGPAQFDPPSTLDIIAKALAENGKHFTTLRDDERITIVLTVSDGSPHALFTTAGAPFGPSTNVASTPSRRGTKPAQSTPTPSDPVASTAAPAQDYELLADMHLKQKRYDDAISAYSRAVAKMEADAKTNPNEESRRRLAELLIKQSQALAATDQSDAALALLKRINALNAGSDPLKPVTGRPIGIPGRTPAKLIISATKRQMSEVAAGRISFDDFRNGLRVEDLTTASK